MKKVSILLSFVLISFFVAGCSKEKPEIICSPESITLPGGEGEFTLTYSITNPLSGGTVSAVSGDEWISDINTDMENTLTFHYAANKFDTERETILQINYANNAVKKSIKITQSARENLNYNFGLTSVNDFEARISITQKNSGKYYYGVASEELFSKFINDKNFLDYVTAELADRLSEEGLALEAFLSENAVSGEYEYNPTHLEPETEYVVYAFSVSETGKPGDIIEYMNFFTKEAIDINLTVDVKGPTVTLNAEPTYDDRRYLLYALSAYECSDDESKVEDVLAEIIQEEIKNLTWQLGITVEEYVQNVTLLGKGSKSMELYQEYDYYAVAVCLDNQGNFSSELSIVPFSTGAVEPSDNVITIEITELTSTTAHYKVSTTNDDLYLFFFDKAENWKEMPDDEMMTMIADMFPTKVYGRRGGVEGNLKDLEPGTEYLAFAFGCEAFTPTTDLVRVYFTTESQEGNNIIKVNSIQAEPFLPPLRK